MGLEIRADYSQVFLLPPSLEEWVSEDHPVRFIRDFVDSLDLAELGFRIPEASDGRPPYAADLLLKVWLYGYMNKIRSTRKLEKACREHMSLVWLTGMNYPDHNTLWRFWSVNKKALRGVFRQVVLVACKAELVGLVLHAVDGTKIAAYVSKPKAWHRDALRKLLEHLDTSIDEVMKQVEQAEENERGDYCLPKELQDSKKRREKIREALDELDRVERKHLHPNDRDARLMKCDGRLDFAFNAQAVVDDKSGLIVAGDVVNDEIDTKRLVPMVKEVERNLGKTADDTVADAGYYSPGQLAKAEGDGLDVLVSMPQTTGKRWDKGKFEKSNFDYDENRDVFICPLGKQLIYERTRKDRWKRYLVRIYRCHWYSDCPACGECSSQKRGRSIELGEYYKAVEQQRAKQRDADKKELLKRRMVIVEPVFAQIKEHQGFRRWTVRGLENVKTQWSMICTAFNLRKLHKYWAEGILVIA